MYLVKRFVEVMKDKRGFLNFLIPAALGIGSAVAGGIGASKANKEAYKRNLARATGIKYSPWTGYKAGEKAEGQSVLGGIFGGGLQGVTLANAINPPVQPIQGFNPYMTDYQTEQMMSDFNNYQPMQYNIRRGY
jgi:hypothetical protein